MAKAKKEEKKAPPKSAKQVAGDTDEGKVRIRPKNIESYVAGVSGSGKRTQNNGDEVATALNGLTVDVIVSIAQELIPEAEDLDTRYANLNVGQQRMNLGNRIRGAVARLNKAKDGSGSAALAKAVKPYAKERATLPEKKEAA